MAASTGIVLAAGGIAALDLIINDGGQTKLIRVTVGTVGAALVSAGLDHVVPGLGRGAAIILLMTAILTSGPKITPKLFATK